MSKQKKSKLVDFIQNEIMFETEPSAREKFMAKYPNGEMTYDYGTEEAVFKVGLEEVKVARQFIS